MNIKKLIADAINIDVDGLKVENLITESVSADKGDYCLPCFALSKVLHKNPNQIAEELQQIFNCEIVEKCEVQNGYLNFFLNKQKISEKVLSEFTSIDSFKTQNGAGKVVCVDYGSPNLAKFLHIGHLKSLIEGESLCRLLELNGYTVKRLDFAGDFGVPFGKIIYGLMHWGSKEDVLARGNDALQEYYVKFNQAEAEDESLTQVAKDLFKKISDKDKEIYPLYTFIVDVALQSEKQAFLDLGVKFDDKRGEMYYEQFVPSVISTLKQKNLLKESLGSQIVDLEEFNLGAAVIVKNNEITLYLTRDIAAAVDRYKDYNYDKLFYVTDVAQVLHFNQLIKVLDLAGYECSSKLEHVPYGRFSLPDGKISSRRGKQAVLVDLLEFAKTRAKEVIKGRTFNIEKPEDVVNKVASGVLNYSVLKVERGKDCVFDVDKAFSFEGETAPYMQYTFTRLESILRKYEEVDATLDYSVFDLDAFELVKSINNFNDVVKLALEKRDASIVAKKVMEMCKQFNKFYTTNKILGLKEEETKAKIALVKSLRETLSVGFHLICIETLKEM